MVSSFTAKPSSRPFRRTSAASGWSSGSPPVRTTPSKSPRREARKSSTSCSGISGVSASRVTSNALWQKGHRRLQPPVNTVAASFPG